MFVRTLLILFAFNGLAFADQPKPPVLTPEEQKLAAEAEKLNREGTQLYQQGKPAAAVEKLRQSLEIREKIYSTAKYPNGHPLLASTLSNVGVLLEATGSTEKALLHHEQTLAMRRKLYPAATHPDGHAEIAASLAQLSSVHRKLGAFDAALRTGAESLALRRKLFSRDRFPNGHNDLAESLNVMGLLYSNRGELVRATELLEEALTMRRKLYPQGKYPSGHSDLATSIANLGLVFADRGESVRAVALHEEAVAMMTRLYSPASHPDGHPELASMLNNLATLQSEQGENDRAMQSYEQARSMCERLYPKVRYPRGHPDLARAIFGLAAVQKELAQYEASLTNFEKALEIRRAIYPAGHPEIAASLNGLGFALSAAGKYQRALPVFEEALALRRALYPKENFPAGHPDLVVTLINLGSELESAGVHDRAIKYLDEAVSMTRALYPSDRFPNGHIQMVAVLLNVSSQLQRTRDTARALQLAQEGVAMVRKLFPESRHPKGHPTVAITLTYLAEAHRAAGDSTAALRTLEEMLAIQRRLATDAKPGTGQHGLFLALNNLAHSYVELRQFDRARPLLTESLAELERLFPKTSFPHGHLYLVTTHLSLGMIAHAKGDSSTARDHLRLAAEMQRSLTEQVIATLSEAEALAWLWAQPVVRDSLLSLSASDPAWNTAVYGMVWNARAPLTRVLQRRHAAARLAASGKAGELNNLRDLRRQTERLLQDTKTARDQRDQTLARLADEQDQLERRLAAVLPEIELWRRREAIGPTDLAAALPAGTVFVDIQTYFRFEPGVPWSGVGRPKIPQHYVAFVVAKGSPPRRIELGPIQPIETAVSQWLRAIVESQPGDAATKVSKIVWEPIALALPADTKTIYISPDGMLARIPWAAIPTGENRILLDDRAVATVPHGPFLAGELRFPRDQHPSADGLTVGGVDFTGSVLPPLPGTTLELKVIAGLATSPPTRLTAADATSQRVANALPSAGWAHLATHGFFAESEFTTERAHAETVAKSGESGRTGPRRVAARNPLGFVGLVLAHGEVLSGLRIVDLKLDNLRLVTLSACETGLGELTGGEGVQGLQRAFHLAGCPNVVASLWKVNDAATAALMTKFYHEMWVNKKPPIEALREAQLTIYRHPELIPELTGERGAVKLKEAVAIQSTAAPRANGKHSDTKLWAAFVLSGVGK